MTYRVKSRIKHNGAEYLPGQEFPASEVTGQLLASGALAAEGKPEPAPDPAPPQAPDGAEEESGSGEEPEEASIPGRRPRRKRKSGKSKEDP